MKFKLEIDLGNDAMIEDEHMVTALQEVAQRFRDNQYLRAIKAEGPNAFTGTIWESPIRIRDIRDGNGNKVGSWKLTTK